jgi:aminopeptidase N
MKWWNDLWLNESFAEYASHLAMAEATEWTEAWTTFASGEKSWAYNQDQMPTTHPIVAEIRDLEDVQVNFDGITYAKGASVLKQLAAYVGREPFVQGVANYFKKFEFKNAVLGDLLTELEATSGRDLKAWSAQWLETAGVNTLRSEISEDAEGKISSFKVLQSAHPGWPTIRDHRMGIGFYSLQGESLKRTHYIELDVTGESTEVLELVGLDRPDLILLNDEDLAYAKIRLDSKSWQFALGNLRNFDDSLARALVWGAAWDATRDGEANPRDFIDLVLNNVAAETQGTMLLTLLRQLLTTTKIYTSPARRHESIVYVCGRLLELAQKAAPGSDQQLLFTRFSTYFAEVPEHGDVIEGLLNGDVIFEGLKLDQDMRWDLINGLVMEGRYALAEIEAELAVDNTANGAKQAIMARTSIRTAEAKKAGWNEVVYDTSLSNSDISFGCQGLVRNHDTVLLEPMVDWYFDAALEVWNNRTFKIAEYILKGAYPFYLANEKLAERTRDFAERADVKAIPALHRMIVENLDVVERALRAQKMDS